MIEQDASNGTAINSADSYYPCYVENGKIVYANDNDGGKLYLKNLNDTSNGTAINSADSLYPCYVGNGQIAYKNDNDGGRLYLKNINDTSNGTCVDTQQYLQEEDVRQKKEINMLKISMADVIRPLKIMISGRDKPYYPVDGEIIIDGVEFTVLSNRCNETIDSKNQIMKIILKTWK